MSGTNGQRLHHIGFVVESISQAIDRFLEITGATWNGSIIHDPHQTVRVTFLQPAVSDQPLIELVEPGQERSRVTPFLKNGGGLHHICYEVPSLEGQLAHSRSLGALIVQKPVPAAAFCGRRIAWVYTPDKILLEYLESGR